RTELSGPEKTLRLRGAPVLQIQMQPNRNPGAYRSHARQFHNMSYANGGSADMTIESDAVAQLAAAYRAGTRSVDQASLAGIDRATAYRIQADTMAAVGERAGAYKIAVAADGTGAIAPIYSAHVGNSGELKLEAARTL